MRVGCHNSRLAARHRSKGRAIDYRSLAKSRLCCWLISALSIWLLVPPAACRLRADDANSGKQIVQELQLLEANPNRPSDSNSADLLKPGVLQLEYGYSREWVSKDEAQSTIDGEVRFGLMKNLEVRWGGNPWIRDATTSATNQGFGDQYLATQWRFREAGKRTPSLALSYVINLPAADERQGLGSGRVDNSFIFLTSKEIRGFTCDFNAVYNLIGRKKADGHDQNGEFFLTFQHGIYRGLSLISEWGGDTQLNSTDGGFATNLWALTFQPQPKVVLDVGFEAHDAPGGPPKRIFFGITYAVSNLYRRHAARGTANQHKSAAP
jgi:hypothetical protein